MNYYAKALEICSEEQNWKKIVIEAAKINPSVIVKAFDATGLIPWEIEAKRLCLEENKIEAIKYCRGVTGMGLKDSKEAVEKLIGTA
jgi:ribosomal protein L7/L12